MTEPGVDPSGPSEGAQRCPDCGETVEPAARFCEGCGAALDAGTTPVPGSSGPGAGTASAPTLTRQPPTSAVIETTPPIPGGPVAMASPPVGACPSCGSGDGYDQDGFCLSCGMRSVRPRDRMETDLGRLAAVSDKGPRKVRNEDSYGLVRLNGGGGGGDGDRPDPGGFVLAVCDGVSNIPRSDEASQAACDAAVAVLGRPVAASAVEDLMIEATARASEAVNRLATPAVGPEPPSCTYLAVRWRPGEELTVGWLGDCRAYVVSPSGVTCLTTDHSWGSEAVASGSLTQAEADRDDRSHAITRWLGADASLPPIPAVAHYPVPPGSSALLVACSDGAWNYLESTEQVATFFNDCDLLEGARQFTQHAIDAGGHDNITVAAAWLQMPSASVSLSIQTEPV